MYSLSSCLAATTPTSIWEQPLNVFGCVLLVATKTPLKEDGTVEDEEDESVEHGVSVSMTVFVTEEEEWASVKEEHEVWVSFRFIERSCE